MTHRKHGSTRDGGVIITTIVFIIISRTISIVNGDERMLSA